MREAAHVLFGNVDALMRGVDKKQSGQERKRRVFKVRFKIIFLVFSFSQNTNTRGKSLLIFLSLSLFPNNNTGEEVV